MLDRNRQIIHVLGAGLALAALHATIAQADPRTAPKLETGQSFLPYVHGAYTYDSNLFRFSGPDEAQSRVGTTRTSDMIKTAGAGFKFRVPVSLQTFKLDAYIERDYYQRFGALDHTAGNADGSWDWEIGRLWSGTAKVGYFRDISSFDELQQPVKDVRTGRSAYVDADFNFIPEWDLIFGGRYRTIDHDQLRTLDIRESTGFTELHYETSRHTIVGVRADITHANLPNPVLSDGELVRNDYNQQEYSLVSRYTSDTESYLQLRLGVTRRQLTDNANRDFTGVTGQLLADWAITGKTSLLADVSRKPASLDDQIATYAIATGGGLGVKWKATPKITLTNMYRYEKDEFRNNSGLPDGSARSGRVDKVATASLIADYQALYNLDVLIKMEFGDRQSNEDLARYHYAQFFTGISYGF